jgi:hypothetical protein
MGKQSHQARQIQPSEPDPTPTAEPSADDPKVRVGKWTGELACALWVATRDNIHEFAGWLGVGSSTVETWKDHPTIIPTPTNQRVLDEALCRLDDEAKRKFAILTKGNSQVWVSNSLGLNLTRNGDHADREQFLKAIGATLGTAAAQVPLDVLERIAADLGRTDRVDKSLVTSHGQLADVLAGLHRSSRPDVLLDQVAKHADDLLGLFDRHMAGTTRRQLDIIATESCLQAGMLAFLSGDRTAARHHFAMAQKAADDAGDDTLRAWTLGASSMLVSSIPTGGVGGDTDRAVKLLRRAVHHARRSDARTRAWAHRWLAMELAAADDEHGFREHMQQADRLHIPGQTERGYPARSLLGGPDLRELGVGLVLLRRANEAVEAFTAAPSSPEWPIRQVAVLVDLAAARVLQAEPEQACAELTSALAVAVDSGYLMGITRIHGVRTQFDPSWATLACVRDLDELLQLAT